MTRVEMTKKDKTSAYEEIHERVYNMTSIKIFRTC